MRSATATGFACVATILLAIGSVSPVQAQLGNGTWVRQSDNAAGGGMTMTVESCCHGGRRLIYHAGKVVLTVESPMDGTDVPVLVAGKPSGETMGIKRVDDRHLFTVLKMNGEKFGTSKSTLSVDGRTLVVENQITSAVGGTPGTVTERWVRK